MINIIINLTICNAVCSILIYVVFRAIPDSVPAAQQEALFNVALVTVVFLDYIVVLYS